MFQNYNWILQQETVLGIIFNLFSWRCVWITLCIVLRIKPFGYIFVRQHNEEIFRAMYELRDIREVLMMTNHDIFSNISSQGKVLRLLHDKFGDNKTLFVFEILKYSCYKVYILVNLCYYKLLEIHI